MTGLGYALQDYSCRVTFASLEVGGRLSFIHGFTAGAEMKERKGSESDEEKQRTTQGGPEKAPYAGKDPPPEVKGSLGRRPGSRSGSPFYLPPFRFFHDPSRRDTGSACAFCSRR
jgi:hypothetical protein